MHYRRITVECDGSVGAELEHGEVGAECEADVSMRRRSEESGEQAHSRQSHHQQILSKNFCT